MISRWSNVKLRGQMLRNFMNKIFLEQRIQWNQGWGWGFKSLLSLLASLFSGHEWSRLRVECIMDLWTSYRKRMYEGSEVMKKENVKSRSNRFKNQMIWTKDHREILVWKSAKFLMDIMWPISQSHFHVSCLCSLKWNLFIVILVWCLQWSPWACAMTKWIMMRS